MLSQGSDIKALSLSHMLLVLQGVPGEAGAPGLVGPRVSVLVTIPARVPGPALALHSSANAPSSTVALGPGLPVCPPLPCFSLDLHPISFA